jgi:hypothetical protein
MPRFHKSELARLQLQTAVEIFLNGMDRSSVITLAGAASGILDTLVKKAGKEPFIDYARRVHLVQKGSTPKRQSFAHHINKWLGVVAHKHLSKDDAETVELDLEKQAADALIRAITDYIALNGQDEPFVRAFLQWTWINKDGAAQMAEFASLPTKLRPKN